jgi:hypothetical protein
MHFSEIRLCSILAYEVLTLPLPSQAGSPVIWVQHDAGDAPIFSIKNKTSDFIGDVRPQGAEKAFLKHFASR